MKVNYAHKISVFVAKTGVLLSLTIILQFFGTLVSGGNQIVNQFISGSLINFMLLMSVMTVGIFGAAIIGFCTPFMAILFGVAAMPPSFLMVPFIALGNVTLVTVFFLLIILFKKNKYLRAFAIAIAGTAKWLYLNFVLLTYIIPLILPKVPPALAVTFGITQLFTAFIGGTLAYLISFKLKKYIKY